MPLLACIAALLTAALMTGVLYQRRGLHRDARRLSAPGRMIDMGNGRRLHIYELGSREGPTVVLESGMSATSLNWRDLQNRLAPFARVVAYDRAGLGWSDTCPTARTPLNLALELRSLLEASEIEPPYVLVGHSFGSFIVQRFAALYPDDVAGVLLLDPLPPEEWAPLSLQGKRMLARGICLARRGVILAHCGVIRIAACLLSRGSRYLARTIDTAASGHRTRVLARVTAQVRKMPREVWPMIAAHWCDPTLL